MSLKAPPVGPHGLNERLSTALIRARVLKGRPAYEIAATAGVHPSEVSRWVNGHKLPTRTVAEHVAAELGVPVDQLFTRTRKAGEA